MYKRILATVIGLLAFAVVPAMAAASPQLKEGTTAVAPGSAIRATNSGNIVLTTSAGNVTCTTAQLDGTLVANAGSSITGNITSASFSSGGSNCTSTLLGSPTFKVTPQAFPWCLSSSVLGSFSIKGGACGGSGSIQFTLDGPFGLTCVYTAGSVSGTYNTLSEPLILTVTKQKFTSTSGGLCPGTGELDGSFKLETQNGTNLKIT